ncbi:MAG: HAD-IB family phosphatase [Eubacterium sp.]|jgi:HAD superfamily phosphoserine phosphatase-like hydrolase|nr:HAD-IB family phosphatase [Eubacterium sp.]
MANASRFIFLFDLDSTITRQEILPTIAEEFGVFEEMRALTERTMRGELPFKQSFLQRVELLKGIPVSEVRELTGNMKLNRYLMEFMKRYQNRCYIVTGNLDVWIENLVKKLGMEKSTFCSKALVENDYIQDVLSVVDKNAVINQMVLPFVAVGDGNNDAEMIEAAEIGIGYGGVREIAPSVLACASHAVYQEEKLVEFLERLV